MDTRLAELERRLARAERQMCMLRGLALAIVGLGTFAVAGRQILAKPAAVQRSGTTVRAPFRVVDARGRTLAVVDTGNVENWHYTVGTRLRLFDEDGTPTSTLVAANDGGGLALDSKDGKRSVGLFAGSGGGALKIVHSSNIGQPAAVLSAHLGGCTLALHNREGSASAVLEATKETGKVNLIRDGSNVFTAPSQLEDRRVVPQ